jgi:hypothetical protein
MVAASLDHIEHSTWLQQPAFLCRHTMQELQHACVLQKDNQIVLKHNLDYTRPQKEQHRLSNSNSFDEGSLQQRAVYAHRSSEPSAYEFVQSPQSIKSLWQQQQGHWQPLDAHKLTQSQQQAPPTWPVPVVVSTSICPQDFDFLASYLVDTVVHVDAAQQLQQQQQGSHLPTRHALQPWHTSTRDINSSSSDSSSSTTGSSNSAQVTRSRRKHTTRS